MVESSGLLFHLPLILRQGGSQLDMGMDGVKEESMNTQTVNMESVEEVKVVAVNNSAEFSRVG